MRRINQWLFLLALVLSAWYAMMALHELGHVIGARVTGGTVTRVILHPLKISRTDVEPNPKPGVVVWSGPILGCLLPVTLWLLVPSKWSVIRRIGAFFAGFCLITNGAYIGFGVLEEVGDCREMLRYGTPEWVMILFGTLACSLGLHVWHQLGSWSAFLREPQLVKSRWTVWLVGVLGCLIVVGLVIDATGN